ncbi:zf-HC2 domain-containing protein [Nonomuraea sp. NPDC049309]|uniref:anti-sigma factor family protein n=1 Tax=Nonomuraea sp. NPDC049309 TaxID=3364350 RepID=UPI00371B178F
MTCEEVRIALGAHALGALDPEEALEIDNHLATCEACGAELEELAGVTTFLGKVSERDVEVVSSPPRQVLDRLLNDRAKRSRRGRILAAVAACAAVLVVGGTVWTAVQARQAAETSAAHPVAQSQRSAESAEPGDAAPRVLAEQDAPESGRAERDAGAPSSAEPRNVRPSPSRAAPTEQPYGQAATPAPEQAEKSASPLRRKAMEGREFSGANKADGYGATVQALPGDGGTELGVRVTGIPVGTTCSLVAVGGDGRREATESWTIGPDTYRDKTVFSRRTSMAMDEIARFEILDASGRLLVEVPVRK